jgi:lysophospholipase L1-like esterase
MSEKPSRLRARLAHLYGRPWFRGLLYVLLILALAEVLLRVSYKAPLLPGLLTATPGILWMPEEGDPRDASFSGDEVWGTAGRTAVFVGDSSVYGHDVGMKNSFPALAASYSDGRMRTLNLAVPGHSSLQSLAVLAAVLPRERPELVVVCNLWSDSYFGTFVDRDTMEKINSVPFKVYYYTNRFLSNSAIWRALLRVSGKLKPVNVGWGQRAEAGMTGQRRVPINDYARNLEQLAKLAKSNGAEVLFLMLPHREDLDSPGEIWPWHPYRQVMAETAARLGYPLVRMAEATQKTGLSGTDLFLDELHPSYGGHQVIARVLVEKLGEWGWFDGASLQREAAGGEIPNYLDPMVAVAAEGTVGYESYSLTGVVDPVEQAPSSGDAGDPNSPESADLGLEDPIPMHLVEVVTADDPSMVLDSTLLMGGSLGFVLTVTPPQQVVLRLTTGELRGDAEHWFQPTALKNASFDLRKGPTWGLRIDVDGGVVGLPPAPAEGWPRLR